METITRTKVFVQTMGWDWGRDETHTACHYTTSLNNIEFVTTANAFQSSLVLINIAPCLIPLRD